MIFNWIKIPCKRQSNEWFTIVPLGDIHEGNAGCDLDALQKEVDYIAAHDNTFWVGMGDYIEAIVSSDKRWDIKQIAKKYRSEHIDRIAQIQMETICEILFPIREKSLGILRGNHEERLRNNFDFDVTYEMWKHLNEIKIGIRGKSATARVNTNKYSDPRVKLLYDSAVIRLTFTGKNTTWTQAFDIFATHGSSGGRKSGSKANRLEDLMADHDVDIVLMGHAHTKLVVPRTILYFNERGRFVSKKKRGVVTGSFLKGYTLDSSSYVEKAGFPPTEVGTVKIQLNPMTRDIRVIM